MRFNRGLPSFDSGLSTSFRTTPQPNLYKAVTRTPPGATAKGATCTRGLCGARRLNRLAGRGANIHPGLAWRVASPGP